MDKSGKILFMVLIRHQGDVEDGKVSCFDR